MILLVGEVRALAGNIYIKSVTLSVRDSKIHTYVQRTTTINMRGVAHLKIHTFFCMTLILYMIHGSYILHIPYTPCATAECQAGFIRANFGWRNLHHNDNKFWGHTELILLFKKYPRKSYMYSFKYE